MKSVSRTTFGRLLLVCPASASECLAVAPVLTRLHDCWPTVGICLMVSAAALSAARSLPHADEILETGEDDLDAIARIGRSRCDGALIFTSPGESPYRQAYRCYLAGVPVRVGISAEFGGAVLSHRVSPRPDWDPASRHLSLLEAIGG